MADVSFLDWPFFEPRHKALAAKADAWAAQHVEAAVAGDDEDAACRDLVAGMGAAGLLDYAVVAPHGGFAEHLDVRSLCIIRETLARHHGLADFAFAMQGLGSGPICLFGSDDQKARFLPGVARGEVGRRLRAHRTERRFRRGGHRTDRRARRRRLCAERREDVDLERRALPTNMWSSPVPAMRPAPAVCPPSSCRLRQTALMWLSGCT